MTSADRSRLLEPQPDVYFGTEASGTRVIYVNEKDLYQEIDGFGASMTDSSAWLIYTQMPETQRTALMSRLFSRADGIGISVMRIPMGASDFVNGPPYTYDDMPPGQADPDLEHFSIEHDRAYIIPAIQDALRLNPDLKLMASPWSPPAWMKTSDSLHHGSLQRQYYAAFAQYFVKFVQAYEAEGLPIYAITIQNEPYYEPYNYPGMRLEPGDEAELVKSYLAPAFEAAGIDTKILIWDHNWDGWEYPIAVLDDPAAKALLDGSAFHCYAGVVIAQGLVHDAHPDKDIYFTECSGGTWIPGFAAGFESDMRNLVIGATRYWARTVIKWNLALDASHDPHTGGCSTCDGLVTIDPRSEAGFTYNFDYYSIGHASKFVLPGAHRIASSTFTYNRFESVAFLNPDGSKVLIVSNSGGEEVAFALRWGGHALGYTLPAGTAATFTWNGAQENPAPPAPPTDLTAKVEPGRIILKWEFSPLAVTYTVKRADQPGGPYTAVASGIARTEYFDSQAVPGRAYYYVVSAANEWGESADSTEIGAVP
jgi:glucosylceramidase